MELMLLEQRNRERLTTMRQHRGSILQMQDYQIQLMLLEQHNKKRLMMQRQEQSDASGSHVAVSGVTPSVPQQPNESQDAHVHRNPEIPVLANTMNIDQHSQAKRLKLLHTPSHLTNNVHIPFEVRSLTTIPRYLLAADLCMSTRPRICHRGLRPMGYQQLQV